MAGNSNSGRRGGLTKANEEYRLATIDECWKLIRENIHNETLDLKFRLELAAKHTAKSIPTELTGGVGLNLTAMGTIKVDGKEAEFKIGSPADPSEDPQPTT